MPHAYNEDDGPTRTQVPDQNDTDGAALDWLMTWVMAQDMDAWRHYFHIADGDNECGCKYEEIS